MSNLAYPLPALAFEWILPSYTPKIEDYVQQLLGMLPQLLDVGTSFDPVADWVREQCGDDAPAVLEVTFQALLNVLLRKWNDLDKPLSALEHLVLDFRSAPSLSANSNKLLQVVAGISEYEGEDRNEQERRRDRIYQIISTKLR